MPDVSRALARPRLLDKLSAKPSKLIWISGSPGSGKTTLAASFANHLKQPCIWLRIDPTDIDSAGFFLHLTAAVVKAGIATNEKLPSMVKENLASVDTWARHYFRTLFQQCKNGCVIVFDDMHMLPDDSAATRSLSTLLEEAHARASILVTSREAPPTALARASVNNEVYQLKPEELSLTQSETQQLLTKWRIACAKDQAHAVHALTAGWVTGLLLCRPSLEAGITDKTLLSKNITDHIQDYFNHEVFSRITTDDLQRLCQLAWLPFITEELADGLTGSANTCKLLARMERQGQFVFKHQHTETGFSLNSLFTEALRQHAETHWDDNKIAAIKNKTALALARAGHQEMAIDLWIAIEAFDQAADAIITQAGNIFAKARLHTLKHWILAMPEEVLQRKPWLSYWLALCLLMADPEAGRKQMLKASREFKASGDNKGLLLALSYLIGSYFMSYSSAYPLREWLDEIERLEINFDEIDDVNMQANIALSVWYGLFLVEPDHPDLPLWEERLHRMVQSAIDPTVKLRIGMMLSKHYYYTGQYKKIWPLRALLLPERNDPRLSPYGALVWRLYSLPDCWSRGAFDEARKELDSALELSEQCGIHLLDNHIIIHTSTACLLDNSLDDAAELLERVPLNSHSSRHMEVWHLFLNKAWLACLAGRHPEAAEYAEVCLRAAHNMGGIAPQCFAHAALGYIHLAQSNLVQASNHQAQLQALAERTGNPLADFHANLIMAKLALQQKQADRCAASLQSAFEIGRQYALFHFVWATPDSLRPLCIFALEHEIETDYTRELIRQRNLGSAGVPLNLEQWPWQIKIYTLGRFAVEVDGKPLANGARAQTRTLALLKAIIALGGHNISASSLCDALWPESDGDAAHHALETGLYRLRKLLGKESIVLHDGKITLAPEHCWVDALAFLHLPDPRNGDSRMREQAQALYQGSFLEDEPDATWALNMRKRLHEKAARHFSPGDASSD